MIKILRKTELYRVILRLRIDSLFSDTYYASIQTRKKYYVFYGPWRLMIERNISVNKGFVTKDIIDKLVEDAEKEYKEWVSIK